LPVDEKTYKKMKKVLSLLTIFRSKSFSDEQMPAMLKHSVASRAPMPRLRRGGCAGIGGDAAAEF
jgi:hypothetical protein